MKRTKIMCPNCMKKYLLDTKERNGYGEPILRCDGCGQEFSQTGKNTVIYK